MQVENIIALFQLRKTTCDIKKQKEKVKLFVRLIPCKAGNMLLNSEIFEDETFKENTKRELWKNFGIEDFIFINGTFYDSFENKFSERIIQCSSICLLKKETEIDENWFEVSISTNKIILNNEKQTFIFEYNKEVNETYIISANSMLLEQHTLILIDAILKLKNTFFFTNIFTNFVEDEFLLSDATDLFSAFSDRPYSRATFKRRFNDKIQLIDDTNNMLKYKKI